MSEVSPVGNRILVEPDEAPAQTPGGIVLPDQARKSSTQGVVFAVGPGSLNERGERIRSYIEKDDRVVYQKYAGVEVELNGKTLLAMTEDDLIAVICP
jgi:chaperonin GroES